MPTDAEIIAGNLAEVRARIAAACRKVGRRPEEVTLVAVTKTVGSVTAKALVEAGALDHGENRAQELERKAEALRDLPIRWHMIGHLQRNKVRAVLPIAQMIHSVDSLRLAQEIADQATKQGRKARVLIEVNVSGEASKFGLPPGEVAPLLKATASMENVIVAGLMTMPPITADAETSRPHFRRLRELRDSLAALRPPNAPLDQLSMGMSQDYAVAVEEGATLVRVGTALFRGLDRPS
jgi:pyridoxal phosphate enzyme (YggS family)